MTELMRRRRALMVASSAPTPSEWDSVWEYTDGLPTVEGWTRDTTGGTCSLTTSGLTLINNTFSRDIAITDGVIEAKFVVRNERTTSNVKRGLLRIGDSTNSIYVVFVTYPQGSHKIRLRNASSWTDGTQIGTFVLGGEYVVRIDISGSTGAVYINNELVKDNINTTSMTAPGTLLFGDNEQYGGGEYWQYVKYKKRS